MRFKNTHAAAAVGAAALLAAGPAFGEIVFREDFETGTNPFDFDAFQPDGGAAEGEPVDAGPPHDRVWRTLLPANATRRLAGHRLVVASVPSGSRQLHWAAYVKFGDKPGTTPWRGDDSGRLQLVLPLVADVKGETLLSGRFLAADRRGRFGTFELTTSDGRVHRPIRGKLLAADRWNAIEFAVEDGGARDTVRIWIDNDDRTSPDYQYTGGDIVDSASWQQGLRFDHGYIAHPAAEPVSFFYDSITVANDFVGLPVARAVRPAAPGGLQVE